MTLRARLVTSDRLCEPTRYTLPSCSKNYVVQGLAAAAHERDEFNAQTCIGASDVIRQPHCPNATSTLLWFSQPKNESLDA